jgi:hypothetical protein
MASHLVHRQESPATEWVIDHPFGNSPYVVVYDDAGRAGGPSPAMELQDGRILIRFEVIDLGTTRAGRGEATGTAVVHSP